MRIYVNSKRFGDDYEWHHVTRENAQPVEYDPDAYTALKQLSMTRTYAAILYRACGASGFRYGVYWGPAAKEANDHMTRMTQFTLLVEFREAASAKEFYGGILRHWWDDAEDETTELGQLMAELMADAPGAAQDLRDYLQRHLDAWQHEKISRQVRPLPTSRQPLWAQLGREHLQQVVEWLRYEFDASLFDASRQRVASVTPLLVVTRGLVPQRLQNVWRALTDRTEARGWVNQAGREIGRPPAVEITRAPVPQPIAAPPRPVMHHAKCTVPPPVAEIKPRWLDSLSYRLGQVWGKFMYALGAALPAKRRMSNE